MQKIKLNNIDKADIGFLLMEIENSFGIQLENEELKDIRTFGELCDCIINRIQLENTDDCTTQQSFYKLRNAIGNLFNTDAKTISPEDQLKVYFPRFRRRKNISALEKQLGFKLNLLAPPSWLVVSLIAIMLISFVGTFFSSYAFWIGLAAFIGLKIAFENGTELKVKTFGELAEKMTGENYVKTRRNSNTYNKNEIEKIIVKRFADTFDLKKSELTKEALL